MRKLSRIAARTPLRRRTSAGIVSPTDYRGSSGIITPSDYRATRRSMMRGLGLTPTSTPYNIVAAVAGLAVGAFLTAKVLCILS